MTAIVDRRDEAATSERTPSVLAWHTRRSTLSFARWRRAVRAWTRTRPVRRLDAYGLNELQQLARASPWHTLAAQFKNVLILILLAATLIDLLGHALEAIVIAVIICFAVLLGFIQEYRAERALEALRRMAAPLAHVIRGGIERTIAARDAPGDLIVLRAGDRVPADSRLTTAMNLAIDDAALTGESAAIDKTEGALPTGTFVIDDRRNMAYAGTVVTYRPRTGHCRRNRSVHGVRTDLSPGADR